MQKEEIVFSEPMTFDDALEHGYTISPVNPNKDGYHIVYKDGTHNWMPKFLFEKTYIKDKEYE